jgi:hypothetical protein
MRGKTPAEAELTTRANGLSPYCAATDSEASSSTPAPSFTPDAFPAVTVPFGFTIGFNLARPSSVVSGRGCSSLQTICGSPFFFFFFIGMILFENYLVLFVAIVRFLF